ncbi:MAG: substrate-binding domain-containing protein [Anaerolineae bacterium]|nr:substrate-binding domain-containing protein [Anaerolineae bacterium]
MIAKPIKGAKRTIVILSLALAGCRGPVPAASPTPETLSLRLLADHATMPLLRDLVSHYRPASSLIAWDIQATSGKSLRDLMGDGGAPFALVGFTPQDGDVALDSLWQAPVGVQGIAVIVHPNNPVNNLSARQFRAILQGQTSDWADVGGSPGPITVVAQDGASSDMALVQALVLGDRRIVRNALLAPTGQAVVDLVSAQPEAIGFVATGYLSDAVRVLSIEGVLPDPAALTDGRYPIRAPIAFVGRHPPADDAYRAFFTWVQSPEGQTIVGQRYGTLPR